MSRYYFVDEHDKFAACKTIKISTEFAEIKVGQ